MKFTLDQALHKGIEAHKSGQLEEADKYYSAIIAARPDHPDANHNLGVLAVGIGKVEEALRFFQVAIHSKPQIIQFWLSYIDALIKLDRTGEAKNVFNEAKKNGLNSESLDEIGRRLELTSTKIVENQDPPQSQVQALVNLYNQGQSADMIKQAKALTLEYPNADDLWNLIGVGALKIGNFKESINAFKKAIKIRPNNAVPYNNMGLTFKKLGKLEEALSAYKKATSLMPNYAEAYNNMGNTLKSLGKLEEALSAYKKATSLMPNYAQAYNNAGTVLERMGDLNQSQESYQKAISINPNLERAYNNLGVVLWHQGELEKAVETYKKVLKINPHYLEVYNNLGLALSDLGKVDQALEAYDKVLEVDPNNAEVLNNRGNALSNNGKLEQAINTYEKAVSLNPNYFEALNNMGIALQDQGKLDEAIEVYNKAISIKPDYAEAHRNLSKINKYSLDDPQFAQVQDLLNDKKLSDDAKCSLSFAIAKMFEDIGQFDRAFEHLSRGNELRKKLLNYSIEQDKNLFENLKKIQPSLSGFSLGQKKYENQLIPVFILGMPRSGTTLVEQIISSHSKVSAGGELIYIARYGANIATGKEASNDQNICNFRQKYLSELSKVSNGKCFITDKMPQNFRFIPLICASFPEAKIIHVHRDAAATCWSNYKQYFATKDLGYSYNLDELVSYYELYCNLMKFWQSLYAEKIYNLDYEKLTTEQDTEIKKLIEYLNLDFEEDCLSPQKNERTVRTASQQQVRERIYKGSSQAWRKYEPYVMNKFDNLPS